MTVTFLPEAVAGSVSRLWGQCNGSMLGSNYRHRTPQVSDLSPRGIIDELRAEAERPTARWFSLEDVWSGPAEAGLGLSHLLW